MCSGDQLRVYIIWENVPLTSYSGFSLIDRIANNANIGIRGFTMWKTSSDKMLPSVGIELDICLQDWDFRFLI